MHFEFVMYWNGESFANTQEEISKWTKELPFWLKITFASWNFELNTAFVYCWLLFMSLFDAESECIHFRLNMQCTVRNCKRKIVQKLSQIEWLGKQYANVQHRWFNGLVSSPSFVYEFPKWMKMLTWKYLTITLSTHNEESTAVMRFAHSTVFLGCCFLCFDMSGRH